MLHNKLSQNQPKTTEMYGLIVFTGEVFENNVAGFSAQGFTTLKSRHWMGCILIQSSGSSFKIIQVVDRIHFLWLINTEVPIYCWMWARERVYSQLLEAALRSQLHGPLTTWKVFLQSQKTLSSLLRRSLIELNIITLVTILLPFLYSVTYHINGFYPH